MFKKGGTLAILNMLVWRLQELLKRLLIITNI